MFSKLHPGRMWWQVVGVLSGEGPGPLDLRCSQVMHSGGGGRAFVCTPVRSGPPPPAVWCLAYLTGVEFFVWGGMRPAACASCLI